MTRYEFPKSFLTIPIFTFGAIFTKFRNKQSYFYIKFDKNETGFNIKKDTKGNLIEIATIIKEMTTKKA